MSSPDFDSKDKLDHLLNEQAMKSMLYMQAMRGRIRLNVVDDLRDGDGDDAWHHLDELQSIGLARITVEAANGKSFVYAELTSAGKALLAHMDYGMRGSRLEKEARKK